MRKSRVFAKAVIASGVALALVVAFPLAASAVVSKVGTLYCQGLSRTTAYSTGTTEHFPPGLGHGIFYNGSVWKTTSKMSSNTGGGTWAVDTTGSLSNSGTYASCLNIS